MHYKRAIGLYVIQGGPKMALFLAQFLRYTGWPKNGTIFGTIFVRLNVTK